MDTPRTPLKRDGFHSASLDRADQVLLALTSSGKIPAAALCVGRSDTIVHLRYFGKMGPASALDVSEDTLFLVASLAKPVTVSAVMRLVERGLLVLDDPAATFLPDFGRNGKQNVTLRHLMTHTSGLPDMPPDNIALRARHAPLSEFVRSICEVPLAFLPGTKVSYQSTGIAILGAIVEVVSGLPLPAFLQREIFDPLGMTATSLGGRPEWEARITGVRLEPEQTGTDWNWNSPYWLGLGAPWGGLITSPVDYARFCRMMLNRGTLDGVRVLSPATVRAMTSNQLAAMPILSEDDRRCRLWGLGWRGNWPGQSSHFGDLLGPRTFGHWGATGTLCWMDPDADAFLVLFTTQPGGVDGRHLATLSNLVAAALL